MDNFVAWVVRSQNLSVQTHIKTLQKTCKEYLTYYDLPKLEVTKVNVEELWNILRLSRISVEEASSSVTTRNDWNHFKFLDADVRCCYKDLISKSQKQWTKLVCDFYATTDQESKYAFQCEMSKLVNFSNLIKSFSNDQNITKLKFVAVDKLGSAIVPWNISDDQINDIFGKYERPSVIPSVARLLQWHQIVRRRTPRRHVTR